MMADAAHSSNIVRTVRMALRDCPLLDAGVRYTPVTVPPTLT